MSKSNNTTAIVFGFLAVAAFAATWYLLQEEDARKKKTSKDPKNDDPHDDDDFKKPAKPGTSSRSTDPSTTKKPGSKKAGDSATTATTTSTTVERSLNDRIEELDQKGKKLYKSQQFLEAAQVFTEALELLEQHAASSPSPSSSLSASVARQRITLRNNRSAMYEKGKEYELAKADCYAILEEDVRHSKTRTRLLRILETAKQYEEALVQVCAMQLLFMQENRDRLRQGMPLPTPPVAQTKIEELIAELLPELIKPYENRPKSTTGKRSLPSELTIMQLLKSFTGFNTWMAQAAKDGNVEAITQQLDQLSPDLDATTLAAQRAILLLKRGRRHVYDRHFSLACDDFEEAMALVESDSPTQFAMAGDYARLLEWVGTVRHWQYDLDSALECFKKCSDLEPTNVSSMNASSVCWHVLPCKQMTNTCSESLYGTGRATGQTGRSATRRRKARGSLEAARYSAGLGPECSRCLLSPWQLSYCPTEAA